MFKFFCKNSDRSVLSTVKISSGNKEYPSMKSPQLLKTLLDFSDHNSKNSHINSSLVKKTLNFPFGSC